MNNPLLYEIERLYNSIEEKENEYLLSIGSNCNDNTLESIKTNIAELKEKLQGAEERFLQESLNQSRNFPLT